MGERERSHGCECAYVVCTVYSACLKRAMELASEKGASSWLTALPITEHGFTLHKGAFRDALCLRYNWQPTHLPKSCVCGHSFTVDHALSCPTGGLPTVRHNELRDFTAQVMTEVCHNLCTEPPLQPLSGEIQPQLKMKLTLTSALKASGATGIKGHFLM